MEGLGPDVFCHRAAGRFQPFFQFACRLVGKSDGDDLPGPGYIHCAQVHDVFGHIGLGVRQIGRHRLQIDVGGPRRGTGVFVAPAVLQQVDDPVDEHSGLAAARASQQQQRALGAKHRLPLLVVEGGKILLDDGLAQRAVFHIKFRHSNAVLSPDFSAVTARSHPGAPGCGTNRPAARRWR